MARPADAITTMHKAFRRHMAGIDDAAYKAAAGDGDLSVVVDRFRFFGEILLWHANGEEAAVFPAMDRVAPLVARPYFLDHRELDIMAEGLAKVSATSDPLVVARATAALNAHLRIHLDKEDAHLYPILWDRTSADEQASIVGTVARAVPPERMPELIRWWLPPLQLEDRASTISVMKAMMPEEIFARVKPLFQETAGEDWAELTRRIPGLA
jgi:hemerythrin-like domain-containing protein